MKKVFLIAAVVLLAFGMQSCKRSIDAVAKDYCEKVKAALLLENDEQLEKEMLKLQEAINEYAEGLTPEQRQEMEEAIQKHADELKLDSIFQAKMYERMMKQAQQNPQMMQQLPEEGEAEPDTIDVE